MQEQEPDVVRGEADRELQRRLAIVESPDYQDPARRALPAVDLAIVAIGVLVTIVVLYWWGY